MTVISLRDRAAMDVDKYRAVERLVHVAFMIAGGVPDDLDDALRSAIDHAANAHAHALDEYEANSRLMYTPTAALDSLEKALDRFLSANLNNQLQASKSDRDLYVEAVQRVLAAE